jgi:hypothetical protein
MRNICRSGCRETPDGAIFAACMLLPRNLGRKRYLSTAGKVRADASHTSRFAPPLLRLAVRARNLPNHLCPLETGDIIAKSGYTLSTTSFAVPSAPLIVPGSPRRHPCAFSSLHLHKPVIALARLRCTGPSHNDTTSSVDTTLTNRKISSLPCPPSDSLTIC